MNSISIIGNLTKDVELRYTQEPKAVANFTIAVNEGYGDNKEAHFFDVVVWGKQAENLKKYCSQGSKVAVEGKLKQQRWETDNGEKRSKVIISAFSIEYLTRKEDSEELSPSDIPTAKEPDPFEKFGQQLEISDDDLPF